MNYLLDTNILIDYLRNYPPTIKLLDKLLKSPKAEVYISAITNLELHLAESITKLKIQKQIDQLLSQCHTVDITLEIAGLAGDFKRQNYADVPDALIAASCLVKKLTLITRNIKHFQSVPKLKITHAKLHHNKRSA